MAVTVYIPTPLRQFTGGSAEAAADGATLNEVLDHLAGRFPDLKANLLTPAGQLPPFVHVFVNGRDIGRTGGLATPVPEGADILIVQAISGG